MVQLGRNSEVKMPPTSDQKLAVLGEDVTHSGETWANLGRSVVGHGNLIGAGAGRFTMTGAFHLKAIRSIGPAAIKREGRVHHTGNGIYGKGSFTFVAVDSELELKLVRVALDSSCMSLTRNNDILVASEVGK